MAEPANTTVASAEPKPRIPPPLFEMEPAIHTVMRMADIALTVVSQEPDMQRMKSTTHHLLEMMCDELETIRAKWNETFSACGGITH